MKCEKNERYDNLVILGYAGKNLHHQLVKCLCDCGREVSRSDYTIRKPQVHYKACGHKDCEYSRIKNLDQDMSVFKKKNKKQSEHYDKERKKVFNFDSALANNILGMGWSSDAS